MPLRFALGGYPVLRDGAPLPGLDATTSAVRTAAGIADGADACCCSPWTAPRSSVRA